MGGRQVPVQNPAKDLNVTALAGQATLPGLSASASLRESKLTVTITNPSLDANVPIRIRMANGAHVREARGLVLTHQDMRATNTFANHDEVKPITHPVKVTTDAIGLNLPNQSVVLVECEIS